jgi:hypothetical protein
LIQEAKCGSFVVRLLAWFTELVGSVALEALFDGFVEEFLVVAVGMA